MWQIAMLILCLKVNKCATPQMEHLSAFYEVHPLLWQLSNEKKSSA